MPILGGTFGSHQLTINQTPPVNCYFEVTIFPGYANGLKMSAVGLRNIQSGVLSVEGVNNASRYAGDLLWTAMTINDRIYEQKKRRDKGDSIPTSQAKSFAYAGANILDFRFNKVSGFASSIDTEEIRIGGENSEQVMQPLRISRDNLVLERGIFNGSPLAIEFDIAMSFMQMMPSDVLVVMQNPNKHIQSGWLYRNAFPVAWSNSDLWSDDNNVSMERMEFSYSHVIPLRQ